MKKLLITLVLAASSAVFAAPAPDKVGDIKTLEVSFQDLPGGTTLVSLKGTVVGLNCQKAFTRPVVTLQQEDVDMYVYGVEFTPIQFGFGHIVCLDKSTTERPFARTLELNTDYDLYFSYLDGIDGVASSFQAMKDAAVCSTPSLPVFPGIIMGPGPVVFETCVYKTTAETVENL